MDMKIEDSTRISRMSIVESGRRRRFSDEAKLAIVTESYSAPRLVTATAHRHGITRFQLNSWRKAAREGRLGVGRGIEGFVRLPDLFFGMQDSIRMHTALEHIHRSMNRM